MAVIQKTYITQFQNFGTYYTSDGTSSEPLTLAQMQVNARFIYKYGTYLGLHVNVICALLGNMQRESGLNPGRWEDDIVNNYSKGFGLVQWTPATKYLNESHPYEDGEPYEMLNNLYHVCEYTSLAKSQYIPTDDYPETYLEFMTSTKSISYLTKAFLYNFERASAEALDERIANANYWYEFLTGNIPPIDPDEPNPPTPTPSGKKKKGYNFVLFNRRRRIYG